MNKQSDIKMIDDKTDIQVMNAQSESKTIVEQNKWMWFYTTFIYIQAKLDLENL